MHVGLLPVICSVDILLVLIRKRLARQKQVPVSHITFNIAVIQSLVNVAYDSSIVFLRQTLSLSLCEI